MKIAIDENLPPRLFNELPNILKLSNLEIILIKDQYGQGISDIEWFAQYASDGGQFFLSNDINITRNKAELAAYQRYGLVGIFMPQNKPDRWDGLPANKQAALIFVKWPDIMNQFKSAQAGEVFMLKYNMSDSQKPFKKLGS